MRSVAMMIVPPRAGIDYLPSMPLLSIPKKHSAYAQNMIVEICKPYSVDCTCTGSLLQYPLSISNVHLPYTTYMRMLALLQTWMWSSPLPESDVMNLILQQTLNVCRDTCSHCRSCCDSSNIKWMFAFIPENRTSMSR